MIVRDAGHILMREGKHLRQQVVLVEVFQVVDLIERALVLLGNVLDLVQDLLVVDKARPELVEIVSVVFEVGWIILDVLIIFARSILKRDLRLLLEEIRGDL